MNPGVALVQAYLDLNGYLTVDEFPIIQSSDSGQFKEVTDIDIMGVRFPDTAHVIHRVGNHKHIELEADPLLEPSKDSVDVIIGEVKEGRARINDSLRDHFVLETILHRLGCVPASRMESVIGQLRDRGVGQVSAKDGIPSRIRLMAFGSGQSGHANGYTVVSLHHVASFVNEYLERYHHILNPAELSDPVLGLLHLLRKLS